MGKADDFQRDYSQADFNPKVVRGGNGSRRTWFDWIGRGATLCRKTHTRRHSKDTTGMERMNIAFYPEDRILEVSYNETVRDIMADCVVRNELNGRRHLHDASQVVRAMCEDPYNKPPVMPRTFPNGTWEVSKPRSRTNPYLAPYYIPTDAEQYLDVWALDEEGGYDHATPDRVLDIGYGVHFSTSRTTVGCIRVYEESDLLWLVHTINERLLMGNPVTLTV